MLMNNLDTLVYQVTEIYNKWESGEIEYEKAVKQATLICEEFKRETMEKVDEVDDIKYD